MRLNLFDRFSSLVLFFIIILLPVFFLPFLNLPIEISKNFLLVIGLALSVIFWSIARFFDSQIVFPKSKILLLGGVVVFSTLLSAFFSSNHSISFFGVMFDAGSFWFIFCGFLLFFVSSIVFKTKEGARMIFGGMMLSSAFLIIFQSFHMFFPNFLSLGVLSGKTNNIIGSWNSLGIFAGFSCILYLLMAEFLHISRIKKIFIYLFILFSLFIIASVNFSLVWLMLGVSGLVVFVYKIFLNFSGENDSAKKSFPVVSLVVVLLALFFFMSNQFIGNFVPDRLGLSTTEINPSMSSTLEVAKGVLLKDPIFGLGPNRFNEAWNMYKPLSINNTQFWNTDFAFAFGFLPTVLSTNGILAIVSWLVFVLVFIFTGIKSILLNIKNNLNWEIFALFLLSMYLLIFSVFYPIAPSVFFLLFAFMGVFVGLISGISEEKIQISFLGSQKKSFVVVMFLIVLIIFSSALAFRYVEKFASVFYFRKSLVSTSTEEAELNLKKAISLNENDLYLRTLSQVYLIKLNSFLNKDSALNEEDKLNMQVSLNQAVSVAEMAVSYNRENHLNFQALGNVYKNALILGTKDAYSAAVLAYENASKLNPLNPGLKLAIADALFSGGKISEAKEYANQSLSLKQDYVEALVFLSQIYKQEGNNKEALNYAEKASILLPGNQNISNYLNSIKNPPTSTQTEKSKQ